MKGMLEESIERLALAGAEHRMHVSTVNVPLGYHVALTGLPHDQALALWSYLGDTKLGSVGYTRNSVLLGGQEDLALTSLVSRAHGYLRGL